MRELPSLDILSDEVAAEVAAQERRGEALDSKAGVLLGFAGVLAALTTQRSHGALGIAALAATALAAALAGVAFLPRPFPGIALRRLREDYLTADADFTRLRLMDTQIAIHLTTEQRLRHKARLVTLAAAVLGVAIVLVVVAATV